MTKTRSDLIVATLELLNAIGAGQDPSPEDVAKIDALINGKLDELEIREILYVGDRSEFEDAIVDPLASLLAVMAAPSFGQARNYETEMMSERRLRTLKPSTFVPGAPLTTEYM